MIRFITTFILVILFLTPAGSGFMEQNENQISVNTFKFPYIYVKLSIDDSNRHISSMKVDEEEIAEFEYSQFANPGNKKLIPILLIQNSKDIVDNGYDISIMNLLLRLKSSLPQKENTITFTFNSEIEKVKGTILTVNFSDNPAARLIDSLILITNTIKNVEGYPFIVIIGTGEDRKSIAKKFLPKYPIVFIDADNNSKKEGKIEQIANLSSGFYINLSDVSSYHQIEERLKKNLIAYNSLLLFKSPFNFTLTKKHRISIKFSSGKEFTKTFNINGPPILLPRFLMVFSLIGIALWIFYTRKKYINKLYEPLDNESLDNESLDKTHIGWLEVYLKNEKKRVIINSREFTIGSKDTCNLHIDDFEISALHCIIRKEENGFKIVDLNSRKGVYVNSIKVSSKLLDDKDVIGIGSTIMIFNESVISKQ